LLGAGPAKRTAKIVVDVWVIPTVDGVLMPALVLDIVPILPAEQRAPITVKFGITAVPVMGASLDIIPAMTATLMRSADGVLLQLMGSPITLELVSLCPTNPIAIRHGTVATTLDAASNMLVTALVAEQVPNVDGVEWVK